MGRLKVRDKVLGSGIHEIGVGARMSTTPAVSPEASKTASTATAIAKPPAPAKDSATKATAPPGQSPPDDEEAEGEEPASLGHFVLFNAVPSSIVSGAVHFVGFLLLALLPIHPPPRAETLAINAPAAEQVEELQDEKLDLKL